MMMMMIKDRNGSSKQRDRNLNRFRTPAWLITWRSKLLLGFLLLVFTLFFATQAGSILNWQQRQPDTLLDSRNRYTVLINTWKRYELLKKSVSHYASCSGVEAIRLVWSEPDPPSQGLLSALTKAKKDAVLRIDINQGDDLNNRFKPLEGVTTQGIFSIDDDLLVPCSSLEFGFRVWLSAPDSMVGFVPRMHWPSTTKNNWISETYRQGQLTYTYGGWWSVWWMGTYSMVLTKAAFLHHKYLEYYTSQMPASIRRYIATERNCEDIAMSFMVANLTNAPPIWVKGKMYEIGSSGISSLNGHNHHRTECLNHFTSLYGYMPLVPTNVKAIDANSDWFW